MFWPFRGQESGVNVDETTADGGSGKDTAGDKRSEQVICQEGVRVNQTATSFGGNVLIKTVLQEFEFAFALQVDYIHMGIAG